MATAVIATAADETSPSSTPGYLAWTRGGIDGPVIVMKLGVVLLRRDGGRAIRVSPSHALSASGGMDSRWLVIQFVRSGNSDLELVDLRDRRHRDLPARVNTRAWEWRGSISGPWLLFGRLGAPAGTYRVVLYNLAGDEASVLDSVAGHGAYAEPDSSTVATRSGQDAPLTSAPSIAMTSERASGCESPLTTATFSSRLRWLATAMFITVAAAGRAAAR